VQQPSGDRASGLGEKLIVEKEPAILARRNSDSKPDTVAFLEVDNLHYT